MKTAAFKSVGLTILHFLTDHYWTSLMLGVWALWELYQWHLKHILQIKALEDLGLAQEKIKWINNDGGMRKQIVQRKLKVKTSKEGIELIVYRKTLSMDELEGLKPSLEAIYNKSIDGFTRTKATFFWRQSKITIHFDQFGKDYQIDEIPKMERGGIFFGKKVDKNNEILRTIEDFENLVAVFGKKGSGKSIALRTMIYSFLSSFEKQEHMLVIIDYKGGTDFQDLIFKFEGKVINPTRITGLQEIVGLLETMKNSYEQYLQYLESNKLSLQHFDQAKGKKIKVPPQKYLIVVDELKQLVATCNAIKITKESSDIEIEENEKSKLKLKIASLITNFGDTQRPTGSVMILSSQDSRSSSYLIDFTNLKTLLLGEQNQAQSVALTGTTIARDKSLRTGRFIALANGEIQKVKFPIFLPKENK